MKIIVTGGAGFIGSALIREIIQNTDDDVLNLDKLTYAGNPENLSSVEDSDRYQFEQIDICDGDSVREIFSAFDPDIVMHLAAESHVDRSIDNPDAFIQTNIIGTYNLLDAALTTFQTKSEADAARFTFHHVSTDEVYGSLGETGLFTEETAYQPNSPYSASKASSDHLVRAWHKTYGLPTVLTNCSNNYGPFHFPEKLIPLVILNALEGKPLPIYGDGQQVRDWLFVEDHARALYLCATKGSAGETYNIGGNSEQTNLNVVTKICEILDEIVTERPLTVNRFEDLITYVEDRPGHDRRYAVDTTKIQQELGWSPKESFSSGLRRTVEWYLANGAWCENVQSGNYQRERLGIKR